MSDWETDAILVSIVCTTYNHAPYLEDALRGFLLQRTRFPFEIVIHDDASIDATRKIVERYVAEYPEIIKTVFQSENQYSRDVKILLLAASHASGRYVAFCEGDDFWICPDKLQMQVDAIESFPDCEICFHPALVLNGEKVMEKVFCRRAHGTRLFEVKPIIRCGGSFMPTASMLIRKTFFDRALQDETGFFKKYLMGYFCQVFGSLRGGALYIDLPMSVYRSSSEGSWSQTIAKDQQFFKKWLSSYTDSLRAANRRLGGKHQADFMVPLRRCHLSVLNNPSLELSFRDRHFQANKAAIGLFGSVLWFSVMRWPLLHLPALRLRAWVRRRLSRNDPVR